MAHAHAARVKETSTTTGTGTYNLAGAVTGFQTFVAGIGNGNTCFYTAEDGTNWEEGIGTVTDAAPDTLARTVVLASSNAGAAVNWGAGTRNLFCSPTPNRFPFGQTITPAQLTANANDYNPTGLATALILRVSGDASNRTITGIAGGIDGRVLIFYNADANNVYFANENGGSAAANRITIPVGATSSLLSANMASFFLYDGLTSRWRLLTSFTVQAAQADMEAASNSALFVSPFFQAYHPSAAKFWVKATGNSTTIVVSFNMTSWADTAVGDADGTIATDFSGASWCGNVSVLDATNGWDAEECTGCGFNAQAAGTFGVLCSTITDGGTAVTSLNDPDSWHVSGFGDWA